MTAPMHPSVDSCLLSDGSISNKARIVNFYETVYLTVDHASQ